MCELKGEFSRTKLGFPYYVMSQKYLISGSKRQYHSYFIRRGCL